MRRCTRLYLRFPTLVRLQIQTLNSDQTLHCSAHTLATVVHCTGPSLHILGMSCNIPRRGLHNIFANILKLSILISFCTQLYMLICIALHWYGNLWDMTQNSITKSAKFAAKIFNFYSKILWTFLEDVNPHSWLWQSECSIRMQSAISGNLTLTYFTQFQTFIGGLQLLWKI